MSEILSRAVFETALADQTEAPWEEEVRMILAHDAALRLALAEAEKERDTYRAEHEGCIDIWRKECTTVHAERDAALARAESAEKERGEIRAFADQNTAALEEALRIANEKLDEAAARVHSLEEQITGMDCRFVGRLAETSGSHCPLNDPCDRCAADRALYEAEKERDANAATIHEQNQLWSARCDAAESRLAEATRVMLALVDERDPYVLSQMATLLRATGNTPQADLCAYLAGREVPK